MIGAIIGDIVGSKYEFNNIFDYNFPLFSTGCNYTDDTICTIAVADAILKANGKIPESTDFQQSLQNWCKKYPHPMGGYGAGFVQWINSNNPQPYDSFGNGAAMRVSPVGFACFGEAVVMRAAMNSARCSHSHTEGLIGASAVALMISRLAHSKQSAIDTIKHIANAFYGSNWQVYLPQKGIFDETCQGCVPLAFDILLKSNNFEDAIRKAISYGGDSDTLGTIVGGMAEAMFGVPQEMRDKALSYLPQEMIDVITKFEKKYEHK